MSSNKISRTSKPDDISVELSSRRTGMSFQRTRMSADRTLMSVIRTSGPRVIIPGAARAGKAGTGPSCPG